MVHAYILLYLDYKSLTSAEWLLLIGLDGHGGLFARICSMAACFLFVAGCWIVNERYCLWRHLMQEARKQKAVCAFWRRVDAALPGPGSKTFAALQEEFPPMNQAIATRLYNLMLEGYDLLEITLKFSGAWLVGAWRYPIPPSSRKLRIAMKHPESVCVKALNEGTITSYIKARGLALEEARHKRRMKRKTGLDEYTSETMSERENKETDIGGDIAETHKAKKRRLD